MIKIYKHFHPIVSVIMPAYNRAKFLERSIESVLDQSYKFWELIIVDDGSTDNTFNIVNSYLNKYDSIKYIKHKNRNAPLSRNSAIQASVGKFITFLDSDDEYKPDHIALRVKYLENNRGTDLLHGGVEITGNPFVKDRNNMNNLIHLSECIIGGTFFGKRKVFIKMEGFTNLDYSEEYEFFERVKEKFIVTKVNFQTYIYHRETDDSICNNI